MRLAFVNPPQPYLEEPGQLRPLGLEYLLASVREHCPWVEARILDLSTTTPDAAVDALEDYDVCAYTATSVDYRLTHDLACRVRERHGSMQVIGGPHVTLAETRDPVWASIFKGEGERTIVQFCEDVRDGSVKRRYQEDPIEWLDSLPMPLREGFRPGERVHVMASRGCCHNCSFCASNGMWPGPVRYRSPTNVVVELRRLVKSHGIEDFTMYDDNVMARRGWLEEFCQRVRPLKLRWRAQARSDNVNPAALKHMRDAGCVDLGLGIESFDEHVLGMLAKGVRPGGHAHAIRAAHELGFHTRLLMMISTPGEAAGRTVDVNIEWLQRLKGQYGAVQLYIFMPLPGSAVYERPAAFGVQFVSRELDRFQWYGDRPNARGGLQQELFSPIAIAGMTREEQGENRTRMFAFVDGLGVRKDEWVHAPQDA